MMLNVLAARRDLEIVHILQMRIVLVVKGLVLFALTDICSLTIKYNTITYITYLLSSF